MITIGWTTALVLVIVWGVRSRNWPIVPMIVAACLTVSLASGHWARGVLNQVNEAGNTSVGQLGDAIDGMFNGGDAAAGG